MTTPGLTMMMSVRGYYEFTVRYSLHWRDTMSTPGAYHGECGGSCVHRGMLSTSGFPYKPGGFISDLLPH